VRLWWGWPVFAGWRRLQIVSVAICSHEARSKDSKFCAETRSPELIIKWDQQIVKGEWRFHFEWFSNLGQRDRNILSLSRKFEAKPITDDAKNDADVSWTAKDGGLIARVRTHIANAAVYPRHLIRHSEQKLELQLGFSNRDARGRRDR
jgi:hypothetical protein